MTLYLSSVDVLIFTDWDIFIKRQKLDITTHNINFKEVRLAGKGYSNSWISWIFHVSNVHENHELRSPFELKELQNTTKWYHQAITLGINHLTWNFLD